MSSGNSSDSRALDALRRRVGAFAEERLGELAVQRGWLDEKALDDCVDDIERGAHAGPLSALLVARGFLSREQLDELRPRLRQLELRELAASPIAEVPAEVRVTQDDPQARFGKYVLVEEVGRGGMGVVWRAWQTDLGRWCAVKRLHPEASRFLGRFLREGRLAAQIVHPNLVPIYEVGEIEGAPYLAMAFIDGGSQEGKQLPIRRAVEIMAAVAYAAHELHGAGIVHRDIKPGNVLVDRSGRPYLGDFSLACTEDAAPGLSKSGMMLGTPAYAAPEQLRGERSRLGPRSDVYSLGATLYSLLTGEMPYTGRDSFAVVQQVLVGEPPPLRERRREVSRQIEHIVWKAMHKEPQERYESALEFAADLKRHLNGETVVARPPGLGSRIGWTVSRHRRKLSAVAALALGAAALAMGLQLARARAEQRAIECLNRAEAAISEADYVLKGGPASAGNAHRSLDGARREIEAALAQDPKSARAYYHLGRVEQRRGDLAAAERALTEALARAPADRQARSARARVRLEQALVVLLAARPRPVLVPCCRPLEGQITAPGSSWRPRAAWEQARSLYTAAQSDMSVLSADTTPFARPELISAYKALLERRLEDAISLCSRELDRLPDPEFRVILGLARYLTGDHEGAQSLFSELILSDPSYALAYLGRLVTGRSLAIAAEDCSHAIALRPRLAVAWLDRAVARVHAGDAEAALEDLTRALALEPDLQSAREVRIVTLMTAGRHAEARSEAEALQPPSAQARWLQALAILAEGHAVGDAEALALLGQGLAADPDHAPSLLLRMHVRKERRELQQGLADVDNALRDPLAPTFWHGFRGELLEEMKRDAEAIAAFDVAIGGTFAMPHWVALRGLAHCRQGDFDRAAADFDRAVKLAPKEGAPYFYRGKLRGQRGDLDGAETDLLRALQLNPGLAPQVEPLLDLIKKQRARE